MSLNTDSAVNSSSIPAPSTSQFQVAISIAKSFIFSHTTSSPPSAVRDGSAELPPAHTLRPRHTLCHHATADWPYHGRSCSRRDLRRGDAVPSTLPFLPPSLPLVNLIVNSRCEGAASEACNRATVTNGANRSDIITNIQNGLVGCIEPTLIPTVLLETATSAGTEVVHTVTSLVPSIFDNGEVGNVSHNDV